jgi:hypothetical protein
MDPWQQQSNQPEQTPPTPQPTTMTPVEPPVQTTPQPASFVQTATPLQPTPAQSATVEVPRKRHKKLALTFLIAPTALLVIGIICLFIAAYIPNSAPTESNLFGATSLPVKVLTICGFIGTGLGFVTWLPGIVIGIVLLAIRKK